jgi:bacterioferritin-associated ferredoxin
MYVCLCNSVTDREIRSAVREGVCSMRELRAQLGVASNCGKCAQCACDILNETLEDSTTISGLSAAAA